MCGYEFQFVQTLIPECEQGVPRVYYPHRDYINRRGLPLLPRGGGPFCRFSIQAPQAPGVYLWVAEGQLLYIGETVNLRQRFNTGYGAISPRNCYTGGQSTNCKMNEEVDYEGILWGKLESGGWIDIAAATDQDREPAPIWVQFADEETLSGREYQSFVADSSEFTVNLLFSSSEVLRDVQFSSLGYDDNGAYEVQEYLYTLEEITPDLPFVAGVVFYGDMTAYGISFTDAQGQSHHFAVFISGRNGSVLLEEYEP